jgi:hypothetical protein
VTGYGVTTRIRTLLGGFDGMIVRAGVFGARADEKLDTAPHLV